MKKSIIMLGAALFVSQMVCPKEAIPDRDCAELGLLAYDNLIHQEVDRISAYNYSVGVYNNCIAERYEIR